MANTNDPNIVQLIKEFITKLREDFPDNINFIIIENIFAVLERVDSIAWVESLRKIIIPFHDNVKIRNVAYFQSAEFKNELNKILKTAIENILGVWLANLIPMEIIFSDDFFNNNVATFNEMSPIQHEMVWMYVDLLFTMILEPDTSTSTSSSLQ
jgi:hypothetical protein